MRLIGTDITVSVLALALMPFIASAGELKPLESYPEMNRIWLGIEEGYVRPVSHEQFEMDVDGEIHLLKADGEIVEKGEVWAIRDPEKLELEKRAHALDKIKLAEQLENDKQEAREEKIRQNLELHELEAKLENLRFAAASQTLGAELREGARKAVQQLEAQREVLLAAIQPGKFDENLRVIEEDYQIQLARKIDSMEDLERRSKLTAADRGRLKLSREAIAALADRKDGSTPVWLKSGQVIGTIADDENYEIMAAATGPLLSRMASDELLVLMQDSVTGQRIQGSYVRTDETDSGRMISKQVIFSIAPGDAEVARRSQGKGNLLHVYRVFGKKYRMVPKKDLLFIAPEVLEHSGWPGLVRHVWPGCQVIHVGPQTIAIEAKHAD